MNDRRYRNPARTPPPNSLPRESRERWEGGPPPEYEEEYSPRPPRRTRDFGSAPDQRPPRSPSGPVPPQRPPRFRDDGDPGLERRPSRSSRDMGMPPRGPRYPDGERPERPERPGRGMGRPDGRDGRPGSRPGLDEGPGMRPRRPRPPGSQPRRRRGSARRRLHARYRYGALVGLMLFAAVGGISLGFSDIGGHNVSVGLILAAVPALLVSMGCAAVYIYF